MASNKELADQAKKSRLGTAISNVFSQSKSNLSNNTSNFGDLARGVGYSINNVVIDNKPQFKMPITQAIRQTAPIMFDSNNKENPAYLARQGFQVPERTNQGYRLKPVTSVNKIVQPASNFGANVMQTVSSGLTDIVTGALDVAQSPGLVNKGAAALKILRGGAKQATAATPLYQVVNLLNTFQPQGVGKRFTSGILEGLSQTKQSPETQYKNINLPYIGEIDPAKFVGEAIGFTQNVQNKKLFNLTEKFLPATANTATKWLLSNSLRGGLENTILNLPEIPQNLNDTGKAQWLAQNFGEGAIQELLGQGLLQGGSKVIDKGSRTKLGKATVKFVTKNAQDTAQFTSKQLGKVYDEVADFHRRMNVPVKTLEQDPRTGEFITRPMWQILYKNQVGSVGNKTPDILAREIKPFEIVDPKTGDVVQPTKGVETFEALQADARKYKSADEWMSVKMKDDTTGALSNPDIRVMLTNEWNRLVGNGSRNQKINKIPEQSIISRQKLELIPGDKNSAKIDLIHTKNGWTPRIPDTDINPTGMIYPTKYSAETSIRNDYKSGKLVYNTSKAPTGDYPSVMAGNHVKQVSESGAFLLGTKPQPTKGLEAQDFEFNVGSGKQKVRIIDTPEGRRIQDLGTESIPMTSKQYLESQILRQEPRQTKTTVSPLTISNGSSSRLRTSQSIEQERLSSLQQELGGNLESLSDIRSQVDKEFLSKAVKSNTKSLKLSSSKGIVTPEIDREIAQVERAVDKKVNLLDYFRTPDRVLKKIGLEKESKLLKQKYDSYLEQLPKEIDKVNVWYEQVKNIPGSEQRIFRYLDGQQQTLEGVELKVAKEIQSYLRDWADKLDLPNDKRIASYITHIFEKDFVQKEFDPDLAKIISEKIPGSVYDPFLQQRLGKQGYVEDVFRALDAYVKRATRKYNMDQALEKIENAGEKLDLESWKYVKEYAERINLRPTDTDNLLDNMIKQSPIGYKLGQRPVANLTRAMRQSVYRATLGLNVGSALRNLTQGANTYAELGEKYTGIGYMQMLKNFNSGELETVGVMRNDFIQDRNISAKKAAWERLDKGLFSLFELAEKINRGSAYYGGKARALAKGATEQEAIEAGKAVAEKTQFKFGSIDTPVRLQGDLIKLLTQFQSYNVKQAEFLGEKIAQKDIAGLLRYIGAWSVFIYGAGNVLNLNPFSAIPWGSDIKEGESKIGQTPPIQLIKGLAKTALKSPDSYGSPASENLFERLSQNKVPDSIGASFVPAFSQAKKTIQGIQAYNRGYSQSSGGRARFPIEQNPGNRVKTTIFGQYSTQEARDYFNKDRSVLSETQTEVLSQLPNSQRKEYYNAVITKREADKAENKQLEAIKSGSTKVPTSTSEKVIKAKLEAKLPVSDDELTQVYLSKTLKLPKTNRYEKSQRDSSLYSSYSTIQGNEDLSTEQKQVLTNRIAQELGKTPQDLQIYSVAKEDNDSKTLYAYDQFDKMSSFDDRMRYLVNGRRPINGKILVSDGVIDNLVEDGLIPEALGKDIKDIDLNEDGTLKKGKIKAKGKAAAKAQEKIVNDAFEDLKKIKIGSSKIKTTASERINTNDLTFSGA